MAKQKKVQNIPYSARDLQRDRKDWYLLKLNKLPKQINHLHFQAVEAYQNHLKYARQCGELLIKAKGLVEKTKNRTWPNSGIAVKGPGWMEWLKKNFNGCQSLANNYMRIARNWDGDILKERRLREPFKGSIDSALKALRKPREPDNQQKIGEKELTYKEEKEVDKKRKYLHHGFMEEIEELYDYEFDILFEGFECYFWPLLEKELRKTVIQVMGKSPYSKYDSEDDGFIDINYHDSEEDYKELARRQEELKERVIKKREQARKKRLCKKRKQDKKSTIRESAA